MELFLLGYRVMVPKTNFKVGPAKYRARGTPNEQATLCWTESPAWLVYFDHRYCPCSSSALSLYYIHDKRYPPERLYMYLKPNNSLFCPVALTSNIYVIDCFTCFSFCSLFKHSMINISVIEAVHKHIVHTSIDPHANFRPLRNGLLRVIRGQ
jgi:hypothetical protein